MPDSFTHLHLHTEFSMLDGAARVGDVVAAAVADGQPAIGITDHGNMYGVLDFYKAAREQGIKPVVGIELYQAHDHRGERLTRRGRLDDTGGQSEGGKKPYYHLTVLAENEVGYRNLIQLASRAFLEGYYQKPKCLVAGQEIVTGNGVSRIEEIRVGDRVLTHRGRLRAVTQTMQRRFKGTLYGIRLNNRYGRVTWMTGEHPVLIRHRDGSCSWINARDILAGRRNSRQEMDSWLSFACLPKLKPEVEITSIPSTEFVGSGWTHNGEQYVKETMRSTRGATRHYSHLVESIDLDYDFGFFVGLYAAEGMSNGGQMSLSFHEDELELIDHCRRVVKQLTGRDVVVRGRADRVDYRGVAVGICSVPLALLMTALCGEGANHKRLPSFTFEAAQDFRRGAFEGVLAGDGSDYGRWNTLNQTSRDLAWQMRALSAEFGESFPCITEWWDGHPAHALQYLSNYSTDSEPCYRRTLADANYVFRPISEVLTREYEGTVYNIEVADDHSYVSDFAIHNCDWDLLADHADGVIATTGCLGGHVLQSLLQGNFDAALEKAGRLQEIFGRDNLFVEIQDHGIAEQHRTNPQLVEIARRLGAPLLATNDSHYVHQSDAVAHDALLCVQTGSVMSDPNRFKFHGDQHYLKSAAEMRSLFAELPESCDNTLLVAERCNLEIEFGQPKLPDFPLPEGFSASGDYLRHLAFEGAAERWGSSIPDLVVERLAYELQVIEDMGFSSYFLIVWDLIRHARDSGIRVGPGRGSAAGCAVAYCLRITDLDPIRYDLLFERFLNPSRISMPDIDMDFDSRYRDEMIRYAAERYGRDRVAQIVTFSTIKARAAVRDAARVLGYPYAVGDRVAKAMPPLVMGRDTPLHACLDKQPKFEDGYAMAAELRQMYHEDPDAKAVIDVAKGLEGLRRQDGIHAAAVVITREPLTTYLPVQRKPEPGQDPEAAPIVTQYEMHGVEDLGLLKMDFLGLRNLDVITDTITLIRESRDLDFDIDAIPLDDEPTFEMLRKGEGIGVFQLEGGPLRQLMRSLAPTSFEDIAALVALYRPGPMAANMHNDYADRKNGRKPVSYLHPDAEQVLGDTYGLCIYQEQIMRVAQRFAGYSLAESDNLRKAAGKKSRDIMRLERRKFVEGCERTGYERELGEKWFDIIEPFADYAFNRSHAYGYGLIAYQTAYLKANYPVEYLAALLSSVKTNLEKAAVYLAECRAMGIEVLVPDVNVSSSDFIASVSDDGSPAIPFGLSAVRNVGAGLVGLILAEREKAGPFRDFFDFCERVDPAVLNKRTVESLIKAGAFDSMGHPRKGLLLVFEQIIDRTLARRRERDMGIMSLFGDLDDPGPVFDERITIPDLEFDKSQRLTFEKEMLGLYVSDHPLMGAEAALRRRTECSVADLADAGDGAIKVCGGVITGLQRKWTKRGDLMAVFTLEDLQSAIEVMVFPKAMTEHGHKLSDDAVVVVKGRVDTRDDQPKLVAIEIEVFDGITDGSPPLRLRVAPTAASPRLVDKLKELLADHPGESEVFLHLGSQVLRLPDGFCVDQTNGLAGELRVLLGPDAIL